MECGDLCAFVGGQKRRQVTALQRALLYLVNSLLGNKDAARSDVEKSYVFNRTEIKEGKYRSKT